MRSTVSGYEDRVRIGAGGNKGGTLGLLSRLRSHVKPWRKEADCETHKLQPFEVVHAWSLADWTQEQINDAEWCLWRAFLLRYPKHRGTSKDKSIFIVPTDQTLADVVQLVEANLKELAKVHAAPAPVVDIPFQATAVRRRLKVTVLEDARHV
ncbi:hypothetical protein NZL82_17805 [Sphingomonas sanguinis]|uniref:hypothetical protein n=1 Tax=Sphingomonas sp. LC-1 TaxID=3110957 RepID=UPI0021BA56CF|nr:hypothetical protein [Sphingomonas sp. LC-1]MCT8003730.1 hypothetical protein [Sphingomonas sp. LC-1]